MNNNFLLKADSYKSCHWKIYPKGTEKIYSYMESRGGWFDHTLFFGLQYILKEHFEGVQVTEEKIQEAKEFYAAHFGADMFYEAGWRHILTEHGGKLPLNIRAVEEGNVVPTHNVLLTIENTDPACYWLTNFAETLIMQLWYPTTVATASFHNKVIIKDMLEKTGSPMEGLNFKLHDFGYRGTGCYESAALGGAAHLVNFMGTDTLAGLELCKQHYGEDMAGHSVLASEHSIATSYGPEEGELTYVNRLLDAQPEGIISCVMDSYDTMKFVDKVFGDEATKQRIMNRNGVFVFRPDSGDPIDINEQLLHKLWHHVDGTFTSTGHKLLDSHVRIIQGDGISWNKIEPFAPSSTVAEILRMADHNKFAADNLIFGSGGGLLQKWDRDTQKFAIKASFATINGKNVDVRKNPATDSTKKSKPGKLKLHKAGDSFTTISSAGIDKVQFDGYLDMLLPVFNNGDILRTQSLSEIRDIANSYLPIPEEASVM